MYNLDTKSRIGFQLHSDGKSIFRKTGIVGKKFWCLNEWSKIYVVDISIEIFLIPVI